MKMPVKEEVYITGSSEITGRIRKRALRYAATEEVVLLTGETGVGKNRFAEFIHHQSGKAGKFVTVPVANIPENLFESEMFGHKRGSFTGASSEQKALVEEAEGGTLFLDEVSEIPLPFQVKLLRFIDTKIYRPIGETKEKKSDARIIAATNKDLLKAIEDKEFRLDLYFRLNTLHLEIPPLRKRKQDIRELILDNLKYLNGKDVHDDFWPVMLDYEWPGNIRELLSTLKRAGIDLESPIRGEEIRQFFNHSLCAAVFTNLIQNNNSEKIEGVWEDLRSGKSFWDSVWKKFIDRVLNQEEIHCFLREGFIRCQHSLKKLAFELNIKEDDYPKFVAVLHKYNIHPRK